MDANYSSSRKINNPFFWDVHLAVNQVQVQWECNGEWACYINQFKLNKTKTMTQIEHEQTWIVLSSWTWSTMIAKFFLSILATKPFTSKGLGSPIVNGERMYEKHV